jgi:sigma-B regulation protein RsbU (phosphoserine phosphatase)
VHGKVVSAHEIGGDYYGHFPLGEGRFAVTIAHVPAHGVPAALLISNVDAAIRAFCNGNHEITEAISLVNRSVHRGGSGHHLVSLFYGEVDSARGVLRYTNADHNHPMLRRQDGSIAELAEVGLRLGLFHALAYRCAEVPFGPTDTLLLYSDGIVEATNGPGNPYGKDRLCARWHTCCLLPTGDMVNCLLEDVERFRGGAGQSDDMTAVVVGPRRSA